MPEMLQLRNYSRFALNVSLSFAVFIVFYCLYCLPPALLRCLLAGCVWGSLRVRGLGSSDNQGHATAAAATATPPPRPAHSCHVRPSRPTARQTKKQSKIKQKKKQTQVKLNAK